AGGAALRRRIGYIPGELRMISRLSGAAMLKHLAEISGRVPRGSIDELAERLGLDLTRPARTLSKGNKQKLGLVQAFMHRPELLILDEPTSGLDPLMQREFLAMVREARDAGQTVLLSSHVISEIQQTADQVAVLSQGKLVASGPVATLQMASTRRVHATISGLTAAGLHATLTACGGIANLEVTDVDTEAGSVVRLSATVQGEIDPVLRILGRGFIRDLTVEEPDLQESVLDLYLRRAPTPPEGQG
ncbi:MAG TPA: ABC transporter ATP-binding protein, partial [Microbacterium sp.]|nr:ABC transporter ATP-binding protein [Microbacterium sp.]